MMPEGLVKISQSLYESILPLVKTQVESQIKVRDLSRASVTLAPAECKRRASNLGCLAGCFPLLTPRCPDAQTRRGRRRGAS